MELLKNVIARRKGARRRRSNPVASRQDDKIAAAFGLAMTREKGALNKNVIARSVATKQSCGSTPLTDRLPRPLRRPRNDEGKGSPQQKRHCEERSDEAILYNGPVSERHFYVYIMTNWKNTVLYTGVTNDLIRRVYEHKERLVEGFTKRYNLTKLVYYEVAANAEAAILREKQLKAGSRQKKVELIEELNKTWSDLYTELL